MTSTDVKNKFKNCTSYKEIYALAEEIKNDTNNEIKRISDALMIILCVANNEVRKG